METTIIILLAIIAALIAWRCWRINREVEEIASTLRIKESPTSGDIEAIVSRGPLIPLKQSLTNLLTEIELDRKSERRQRRFFEGMLNQIEDAILILDDNLEIRFSNEAARLLFATDQAHEGRQLIEVCLDHRISDAVSLAIESLNKTREEIRRPAPLPGNGRNEHNYLVEAEPLNQKNGFGRGAWVLIRDTTRQIETEQIRRDFVANASHELRTPLSIISGYLEMLDDDENNLNEDSSRRSIRTMRSHCDRITRIVEDMLTISKLESSEESLNKDRFDIMDAILDSINRLKPVCDAQEASIKIDASEGEHCILGDPFYWDQIFFNLIENALKQNPKPGLKVSIRVSEKDNRLEIEISDNGVGIPAEDLPNIFQRFYRVDKQHAQKIKGTGLGLSIVKRAVEAHQGRISATSQPGVKTSLTISVPIARK